MKYILFLTICLCAFAACKSTKKSERTDSYISKNTEEKKSKYEFLYFSLRDSLRMGKAPVEKSNSIGLQRSALETSLAKSLAFIDDKGLLNHNIENKDSIPERLIIKEKIRELRDTIYIHKTDTIYLDKNVYIEKESASVVDKIKTILGYIVVIGISIAVIVFIVKNKAIFK